MEVKQVSFKGKFIGPTLPRKARNARAFYESITKPNEKLLKTMPFNVTVYCENPTKKAIHPRFYLNTTKEDGKLYHSWCIHISSIDQNPAQKLEDFIKNTKVKYDNFGKKSLWEKIKDFFNPQ